MILVALWNDFTIDLLSGVQSSFPVRVNKIIPANQGHSLNNFLEKDSEYWVCEAARCDLWRKSVGLACGCLEACARQYVMTSASELYSFGYEIAKQVYTLYSLVYFCIRATQTTCRFWWFACYCNNLRQWCMIFSHCKEDDFEREHVLPAFSLIFKFKSIQSSN